MNTMKQIMVGEEEYLFIKEYQADEGYRTSLNRLTMQTFHFDFEGWYEQGLWTDRYRPYSLLHNGQVVANVSVNPIDFISLGQLYHTIQIGTVMTEQRYRSKGLSRILFNLIMEEYEGKVDLMYLYANASVLGFYPKFGFIPAREYIYSKQFDKNNRYAFRKLDGTLKEDRQRLLRLICNTMPVSEYTMVNNPYLPMFYLTAPMAECIYYCEELDLAAVVEYEEESMMVHDIFCSRTFDQDLVISSLLDRENRRVHFGYTPWNKDMYQMDLLLEPDTTFFVKGSNFIEKGRLPILSHA